MLGCGGASDVRELMLMRLLPCLLALFLATPATAQAQQTPAPPPLDPQRQPQPATIIAEPVAMMIAAFDADGDARVTRAEFDAGVRRSFDSVDPQKSDAIGYLAFADWAEKWLGNRNAVPSPFEVDRDGDGKIHYAELATRFAQFFTRFDTDKDGVITRAELLTVRSSAYGMPRPEGRPRGDERRPR